MSERAFATAKDLEDKFIEYLEDCKANEVHLPNIAGFVVFADVPRSTYYDQKDYYSDTIKKIDDILENVTLNAPIPTAEKIFYMKNKFRDRYQDKVITENTNRNIEITEEEAIAELKKDGIDVDKL